MDNNEVIIVSATLAAQGPTGPVGPRGEPAFIKFNIIDGNLIVDELYDDFTFVIVNKCLVVE